MLTRRCENKTDDFNEVTSQRGGAITQTHGIPLQEASKRGEKVAGKHTVKRRKTGEKENREGSL